MNPRIFVPANDQPTHQWVCEHRGWRYLILYWPTDGTQASHPHDLTGIAWRDGVVMARRHLGFEIGGFVGGLQVVPERIYYDAKSHNPKFSYEMPIHYMGALYGYTELTLPEPMDRCKAEYEIAMMYYFNILPDLTHDRQVTPPWEWDDKPKIFNYWHHHRYKWKLRCLRHRVSPNTQPSEIFWEAPDMCYKLLTKR